LPRGDKTIITTPASTIAAIKKLLQFIRLSGRIALVIYHGHPGGQEEKNEVLSFVTSLSQAHYEVVQYAFLNHKNSPPFVIIIDRKSTRLNSSHVSISYAVFCLKKKTQNK